MMIDFSGSNIAIDPNSLPDRVPMSGVGMKCTVTDILVHAVRIVVVAVVDDQ